MGGVEVPRRVRSGEGVSSSPLVEGSGEVPPPHKIFRIFLLKIPSFDFF